MCVTLNNISMKYFWIVMKLWIETGTNLSIIETDKQIRKLQNSLFVESCAEVERLCGWKMEFQLKYRCILLESNLRVYLNLSQFLANVRYFKRKGLFVSNV